MGRPKSCDRKSGSYPTGPVARQALAAIRRRGARSEEGKPTRAYPCGQCGRWHLTSWDYEEDAQ